MNDDYPGTVAHAFAHLGVKEVYSPTAVLGPKRMSPCDPQFQFRKMPNIHLATDYSYEQGGLESTPETQTEFNFMDKLELQKKEGGGVADYHYVRTAANPLTFAYFPSAFYGTTRGIFFDRDGAPGARAGSYNTGGQYSVTLTLHALSMTKAVALLKVNGKFQGIAKDSTGSTWWSPAAMAFSAQAPDGLTHLYMLYDLLGFGPATQVAKFREVQVRGWKRMLP
jgi:hypothetical protein